MNATMPVQVILTSDVTPPANSSPIKWNYLNGSMGEKGFINYTTSEAANATVWFGNASGSYPWNATNASFLAAQNVTLAGLTANKTYYYKVTYCDASGNCANSSEQSFTTPPAFVKVASIPDTMSVDAMHAFNNSLYVAAYGASGTTGRIYKTTNGTNYTNIFNVTDDGVLTFEVFNGSLYAGTAGTYGQIYRRSTDSVWINQFNVSEKQVLFLGAWTPNTGPWQFEQMYAGTPGGGPDKPPTLYWKMYNWTEYQWGNLTANGTGWPVWNDSIGEAFKINSTTLAYHIGSSDISPFTFATKYCNIDGLNKAGECFSEGNNTFPIFEWGSLLANGSTLYAGTTPNTMQSSGDVYSSTDSVNWTHRLSINSTGYPTLGSYNGAVFAGAPYRNIDGTAVTIYRTTDGVTWTPVYSNANATQIATISTNFVEFNGKLYFGSTDNGYTAGAVYAST